MQLEMAEANFKGLLLLRSQYSGHSSGMQHLEQECSTLVGLDLALVVYLHIRLSMFDTNQPSYR